MRADPLAASTMHWSLLCWCVVLFTLLNVTNGEISGTQTSPRPDKQVMQWMHAEKEFQHLDSELQKALGDKWPEFRNHMNEEIQEHHKIHKCTNNVETDPEECHGKGSLTESEYLLHQALDKFSDNFGNKHNLHRYHNMAHLVFENARKMLESMHLLQSSEYDMDNLKKHSEMVMKYKRKIPLAT